MASSSLTYPLHTQRGMTVLIVLLWLACVQIIAVSRFNHSILHIRSLDAYYNTLQARHAAHAGNVLCAQWLEANVIKARLWTQNTKPAYWRIPQAFEGPFPTAFSIAKSWPLSVRPPQCLIESWIPPKHSTPSFYLITSRGFGATEQGQAWEQQERWIGKDEDTGPAKWKQVQRPLLSIYTQNRSGKP